MQNFYLKTPEEVLKTLNSSVESGLSDKQVQEHAIKYGKNSLTEVKRKNIFFRIIDALKEPMLILLIIAWGITLVVNCIEAVQGHRFNYAEVIGIFVTIVISVSLTIIMEGRSIKAFDALNKIKNGTVCKVLREGKIQTILQEELVVGDIVYLSIGDKIMADGRLLQSNDLQCDESALTGESLAVKKNAEKIFTAESTPIAEQENYCFAGTFVVHGNGKMVVCAVGDNTEFGMIAKEIQQEESGRTPLQEKLTKLGKNITIFGGIVAFLIFVMQFIYLLVTKTSNFTSVSNLFITSIVLMVACVPEGLPTIVAISLSINIVKMAKQQVLVKKMIACETVGSVNVICSDKTGTLTENKMAVTNLYANGKYIALDKLTKAEVDFTQELLYNFAVNSTADIVLQDKKIQFIGSPTECALLALLQKNAIDYEKVRQSQEIVQSYSFSSSTKNMTICLRQRDGYLILSKGSPEKIRSISNLTEEENDAMQQQERKWQQEAKRVLAFAHKFVKILPSTREECECNLQYDGFVAIADPLRPEVYDAVQKCRNAGIAVKMLTGDNIVTATEIARQLHLFGTNGIAMEASVLEDMAEEEFRKTLPRVAVIARSTPTLKMRVVKTLKLLGNVVAVTGDGINDAPALKTADVGIAMGIAGTEVSKEAADIVLLDDSFSSIATSIQWGRGIYENFKRFIQFQLTVNVASVFLIFLCTILNLFFPSIQQPFSALDLLWINIIMDGPPALILGLEPIRNNLMEKKPIARGESILSRSMLIKIFIASLFMTGICLLQIATNFLQIDNVKNRTVVFTLFVLFQLFNALNCRELGNNSIFKNFFKNRLMLLVLVVVLSLQIIITQFGNRVFETVALNIVDWCKVIAMALSIIGIQEGIQAIMRYCIKNKSTKKL